MGVWGVHASGVWGGLGRAVRTRKSRAGWRVRTRWRSALSRSYHASWRIYDVLTTTDRDMYHVDEITSTLRVKDGPLPIPSEQQNAELIAPDFVRAVAEGREPLVPGWSVLPTMRVLHRVQEDWDTRHGRQSLPGRPTV